MLSPSLHFRFLRRTAALVLLLSISGIAGAPQVFGQTTGSGSLAIVRTLAVLQERHGGFTYSLHRGNLAGTRGYAVAVFPDRSVVLDGLANERQLAQFVQDNLALLQDPHLNLGGWYDKRSSKTYLDISVVVPSLELAIKLAREYNQKSITDLRNLQEIPVADTSAGLCGCFAEDGFV